MFRRKNAINKTIEAILKDYEYCKESNKKEFGEKFNCVYKKRNKTLMKKYKCSVCNKLFDADYCRITGQYRRSAHWSCNINLTFTKKVPVMFQNLKGYDSHLIMQSI